MNEPIEPSSLHSLFSQLPHRPAEALRDPEQSASLQTPSWESVREMFADVLRPPTDPALPLSLGPVAEQWQDGFTAELSGKQEADVPATLDRYLGQLTDWTADDPDAEQQLLTIAAELQTDLRVWVPDVRRAMISATRSKGSTDSPNSLGDTHRALTRLVRWLREVPPEPETR